MNRLPPAGRQVRQAPMIAWMTIGRFEAVDLRTGDCSIRIIGPEDGGIAETCR